MRSAFLVAFLLSGCMHGCGSESAEAEPTHSVPVRLPSGAGDDEAEVAAPTEDFAEPPPVEPPPPIVAPSE